MNYHRQIITAFLSLLSLLCGYRRTLSVWKYFPISLRRYILERDPAASLLYASYTRFLPFQTPKNINICRSSTLTSGYHRRINHSVWVKLSTRPISSHNR